jgi:hypothetical protein
MVEGNHILFAPSRYSPDTEEGGTLLSKQIAESLRQRSINVPGLDAQLNRGISELKEAGAESAPGQAPPDKKDLLISKDKKEEPVKGKGGKKGEGKEDKKKKKTGRDKSDGFGGKAPKRNPKKSPSSPEEDPAFYNVVKKGGCKG